MLQGTDAHTDLKKLLGSLEPLTSAPAGVPTERVDSYTLQIVDQLFPSPCSGLEFLALLLRLAIAKQVALEMGKADVAEITVQSIRHLAKLIGWSYETTHKYVVLFCALGLLIKSREDGQVKLRFPLCRYQPPTSLGKLDELIARARPKVVSCAKKVRKRFLVLYSSHHQQINDLAPTLAVPPSAEVTLSAIQEVTTDLHEVLALPEAAALHERLTAILVKLERASGRLAIERSTTPLSSEAQIGRLSKERVDSLAIGPEEDSRLARKTVDFPAAHSATATRKSGRLLQKTVDSPALEESNDGRLDAQKSTLSTAPGGQIGRLSQEKVDSGTKLVDSEVEAIPNVNVVIKTLLGSLNVNVKAVISFLIAVFHEEPAKRGYYYNLYKNHASPDAWLAATIETLVGLHLTKTVRSPGKYFYDRCVQLHETIPSETAALVEQYSGFTLPQLLDKWRQPSSRAASDPGKSSFPAVRESRRQPLILRLPRDRKMPGMSMDELKALLQDLRSHPDTCAWRTQPYRQDDGSCALLVENVLQRQRWIYSLREWQESVASRFPPRAVEVGTRNRKSHRKTSSAEES